MYECGVVVKAEIGTESQAFHRLDVDIGIAEETPYVESIVAVESKFAKRILTVGHTAYRACVGDSVGLKYRYSRGHFESVFQRLAINLVCICKGEVLAYSQYAGDIERGVHSGRDILEVGVFEYTFVLAVAQREQRGAFVGGGGY